jgi:hypothetical protein
MNLSRNIKKACGKRQRIDKEALLASSGVLMEQSGSANQTMPAPHELSAYCCNNLMKKL